MAIDKKELEKELLKLIDPVEDEAADLWIEITDEYGVKYKKIEKTSENGKEYTVEATNPQKAKRKQFGSGMEGQPAEFWFEKAVIKWEKKVKDIK